MSEYSTLDSILQLADAGLHVFPLHGKIPYPGTNGFEDASTSRRDIEGWNRQYPGANWGVATGVASGIVVLDIDGPKGFASAKGKELPNGPKVRSGRSDGGQHHWFRLSKDSEKSRIGFLPGLDLKADSGYVVIPPSIHPASGQPYEWLTPFERDALPDMPAWLIESLESKSRSRYNVGQLQETSRNIDLTSVAGTLRLRGFSVAAILASIRAHNDEQADPLPDDELITIAESIGAKEPAAVLVPQPHTEAGYAERMALYHRGEIRYAKEQNRWLEWTGTHWEEDLSKGLRMQGRAKDMLSATYLAADTITASAPKLTLDETKDAFRRDVRAKESARSIDAIITLTRSEPGIAVDPDKLDADPFLFNVAKGTIDLRTGQPRDHDPADLLTRISPVTFDPAATCPRWEAFVADVFAGDTELIAYVRRALGYLLTGDTSEQDFWIAYGSGANGKSTLLNTVLAVVGDYGRTAGFSTFDTDSKNQYGNDVAALKGRRFVFASESERDKTLAEARVKAITGGDALECRFLYGEFFTFVPQFKVWLAVNHKPNIRGADRGIWRRIKLIPFARNFESQEDKQLRAKLADELPGILNWLLAGLADWQANGMQEPESVKAATDEYRVESDQIGQWIGERAELGPDYSQNSTELYRDFLQWLEENGSGRYAMSQKAFGVMLGERPGISKSMAKAKPNKGKMVYHGIRLDSPPAPAKSQTARKEGENVY